MLLKVFERILDYLICYLHEDQIIPSGQPGGTAFCFQEVCLYYLMYHELCPTILVLCLIELLY